jgi:Cdc6-like AAA superfamily ATPase
MDLEARIRRRARRGRNEQLLLNYRALSPVAHVEEPPGRGPVVERILDHLDPVFDGRTPGEAAVWGPPGSGKSAVITSLFDRLDEQTITPGSVIHTTTRAQSPDLRAFVYIDARRADSDFQLYRALLDGLATESVPEHGVSTDELTTRLDARLADHQSVVVAIDHLDEPRTMSVAAVRERLDRLAEPVSLLSITRTPPDGDWPDTVIELPAYGQQVLIDILTSRASVGLSRNALDHDQARTIADWAGGNAHDALAALFGAVDAADRNGQARITDAEVEVGVGAVPTPSKSLGQVLTLPDNRQLVLRELLELSDRDLQSVSAAAEGVAAGRSVDLSPGTVRRFLYELAESGIVERIQHEGSGQGRPPSRLEPRFPTLVFRRLHDL